MGNDLELKNIKNAVIDRIRSGNIKKIPKIFFSLKSFLFFLAIVIVSAFSLFTISFIFFVLKISELWYLPVFGVRGVELLFGSFPWLLVMVALIFIAILETLVDRYSFVYRKPLLYSALAIIFIVIAVSLIINQTSLHERIYGEIKAGELSPMKPLYDKFAYPTSEDFHPGTVLEVKEGGFVLENRDKTSVFVKISESTKIRPGFKIYPGGRLLIIGQMKDGVIEAEVVDNAPPNGRP